MRMKASGRPAIMMEEEKYDKLASEEDLQQDFTEVKRISRELSTSCNDFVYNAF